MFEVLHKDPRSRARVGRLTTASGVVETPSYVIVGTHAEVRCLAPEDLPATKTALIIANTYHLWRTLGDEGLESFPGLHAEMGWKGPLMTDSGGFQVFSLGAAREHGVGKKAPAGAFDEHGERILSIPAEEGAVRVTNSGVYFTDSGEELYLDAELSMKIQEQLDADLIFAFDEPSSPLHDYDYTKTAMERTHAWALRSLEAKSSEQKIYGIVQGGAFEDLRRASAEYIGKLPFDGIGIGGAFGTSFGSTGAMTLRELAWTTPYLPEQKPRHLLGMGKIEDLFAGVEAGVDTFDCVIPTREARHGGIWTRGGRVNLLGGAYAADDGPLEEGCECEACAGEGVSRMALRDLFKNKNPDAGRLATIHNVYFFNTLMEDIRSSLREGRFAAFKGECLARLGGS